jgi:hypothetical protein
MCAGSTRDDLVSLTGRVLRQRLAAGTKSEHHGMVLVTDDGQRHVLRRVGGNPFRDEALEALDGQRVTLRGRAMERFFLVHTISR